MKYIVACIILNFYLISYSQTNVNADWIAFDAQSKEWLDDLYSIGMQRKGDSLIINDESKKILKDTSYYKAIYPEVYTWQDTQYLMKKMALKQAFWYLINLYDLDSNNKELVLQMIVPFDEIIEMDKIIISSFYSYIAFDPETVTIVKGTVSEVKRPDIAERKLIAVKEIISYIHYNRKQKAASLRSPNVVPSAPMD